MKKHWIISLLMVLLGGMMTVNGQDAEAVITLERTACFGTCPVYSLSIWEDGTVRYNGSEYVTVTGEQTSEMDPETVQHMLSAFVDAGYFQWEDAYDTQVVSDLPTITTTVSDEGNTKTIMRYAGDTSAPLALPFLENWIDEMTNSALWTGQQPDLTAVSNNGNSPLLTLRRDPCFGMCPVYTIAAYEDGTVVYTGIAHVEEVGVSVLTVETANVTSVAQQADILGYFGWQDAYDERIMTDQATVTTSIRWEDEFKQIVRYDGDPNAPIGLLRLEERIDLLVTGSSG
ncbi:hypothetical protein G4Y79_05655 [Phototrophicus methaneseepsis]|uniref:DUF6438 domain-containing protein n=1 Tax=Phototrophicus methaneseepsis TaxID=2710758 RepID=A0A7S8IFU8_9CHLR|nr:DUF6438 domain-containing protein [Phototrophicus methaneseepsis]QPC83864.1 hypothetical protein G4Y79_05655 [Phototrophicus methaneseepsis]